MTLNARILAAIIFIVMFGGIGLSAALGWWQTESTKEPATYTTGEFAGQANPADIRGSYTFGDIANAFDVTPASLAQAFQVTAADPAAVAVKDLEVLYLESGVEIGTNSVRLFVAWQLGLPFDTAGQEIYLPKPAAEMLLTGATLTPEQLAYLEAYTVDVLPLSGPDLETDPAAQSASTSQPDSAPLATQAVGTESEHAVKGKTIFGDLIAWGVPQAVIEQIIGGAMPDPAVKVKDYATANGLDFETLKAQLQAEVDKVRP